MKCGFLHQKPVEILIYFDNKKEKDTAGHAVHEKIQMRRQVLARSC